MGLNFGAIMSKKMTLEQRKIVNGSIEYPEKPNKVEEKVVENEVIQPEPKQFDCEIGEFKSVSLLKLPNLGHDSWVSIILTIRNGIVINIEMEEPNLKVISQEQSKINFCKLFLMGE